MKLIVTVRFCSNTGTFSIGKILILELCFHNHKYGCLDFASEMMGF